MPRDWERDFQERPRRTAAGAIISGWGLVCLIVVLIGAIGIGLWSFGVFTSDVKGQGDARKIKNSGENRVQAQGQFQTTFNSIKALDAKIVDGAVQLKQFDEANPDVGKSGGYDPRVEQRGQLQNAVTGPQGQCRNAVADYDAAARTYTLQDFRDADLPKVIDESDPATDCKVPAETDSTGIPSP